MWIYCQSKADRALLSPWQRSVVDSIYCSFHAPLNPYSPLLKKGLFAHRSDTSLTTEGTTRWPHKSFGDDKGREIYGRQQDSARQTAVVGTRKQIAAFSPFIGNYITEGKKNTQKGWWPCPFKSTGAQHWSNTGRPALVVAITNIDALQL